MHDLPHLPHNNSTPMAFMHEHVNACSWHLKTHLVYKTLVNV